VEKLLQLQEAMDRWANFAGFLTIDTSEMSPEEVADILEENLPSAGPGITPQAS
jgi:hypothetical protein